MKKKRKATRKNPPIIRSERDAWEHMEKLGRRLTDRDSSVHQARAAGVVIHHVSERMLEQLGEGIHMNAKRRRAKNPTVRDVPLHKGDYAIRVHRSHYSSLVGSGGESVSVDVVQVEKADKRGRVVTSRDVRSTALYRRDLPGQDIWLKISDKSFRVPPWLPVKTPAELAALFDDADEAIEGSEWIDTEVRDRLVRYLKERLKHGMNSRRRTKRRKR